RCRRRTILLALVPRRHGRVARAADRITRVCYLQTLQSGRRAHGIELLTPGLGKPEETVSAIDAAKAAGAGAINFLATPLTYVVRASAFARRGLAPARDLSMAGNGGGRRPCRLRTALPRDLAAASTASH